jgi:uncharacterized membrane protein YtjA (UPF0391 family)
MGHGVRSGYGRSERGAAIAGIRLGIADAPTSGQRGAMLRLAIAFFVIAIIAAIFGFGGVASGAAGIAKILFFVFIVVAVVSLVAGFLRR